LAAAGVRTNGQPDKVTSDDPWHIGSDTKAMTAALYARLVDQGRAKWGATLPQLFPDLAGGFDLAWANITIEALFSHTAGLRDVGVPWVLARRMDKAALSDQRSATVRDAMAKPPALPVGKYSYSNLGYIIAGAAIERIAGKSWEAAIAKHLFAPLGMNRAGFGPPTGDAPIGHVRDLFGRLQPTGVDNPPALGPAGTVHLPLADWAKFVRVFIDPDQSFLSAESMRRLITPATGTEIASPDGRAEYALGWATMDVPDAGRVLTHDGSDTAWLAHAVLVPEKGVGLLVVTNCAHAAAHEAISAVRETLRPMLVSEG
jgi:CubicO group peptidase (beta-lactamase class C family)